MRILVIDDCPAVRSRLAALVGEVEGAVVAGEAGGAPEALALAARTRPDVVLLDLHLPDGSGLEVLSALKRGERAPAVIVVTNDASTAQREAALARGADEFLDKSIDAGRLIETLERLRTRRAGR